MEAAHRLREEVAAAAAARPQMRSGGAQTCSRRFADAATQQVHPTAVHAATGCKVKKSKSQIFTLGFKSLYFW